MCCPNPRSNSRCRPVNSTASSSNPSPAFLQPCPPVRATAATAAPTSKATPAAKAAPSAPVARPAVAGAEARKPAQGAAAPAPVRRAGASKAWRSPTKCGAKCSRNSNRRRCRKLRRRSKRSLSAGVWLAAAIALALLLVAQIVHANRDWLAAQGNRSWAPAAARRESLRLSAAPVGRNRRSGGQRHAASAREHPQHGGAVAALSAVASDARQPLRQANRHARLRAGGISGQADGAHARARRARRCDARHLGSRQGRGRVRDRRVPARRRSQESRAPPMLRRRRSDDHQRSDRPTSCRSNVVLAPMAGVTDRPFRILCRRFGAGLAASEMLTADVRLWDTPKSRRRMDHTRRAQPARRANRRFRSAR